MSGTLANIGLVLLFILIGGLFAATELSLVSLRESQIKNLATKGRRGARVAELARNPNRFLAAVQIGVTLAGFLSAAFGAATLADKLVPRLEHWGLSHGVAKVVSLFIITAVISFFAILLSELVPKRVALQRAESIAKITSAPVDAFAKLMRPVIWLLSASTDALLRLFGLDPAASRQAISGEELRSIVAEHESLGREERQIVEDVFEAGGRQLREVMIPRTEVDFLDASTPVFKAIKEVSDLPHSRYPVINNRPDEVVGFVHVRDLFDPELSGRSIRVGELARDVMLLPATKPLLQALTEMRRAGAHMAIVVDEYGGTAGIVTLEDLVEELVGDIRDEYDQDGDVSRHLVGGDLEVDGLLNLDDFEEEAGFALPDGPYETVAGFVMSALGRLPEVGDYVDYNGNRLTVSEMDGRRIARVRVTRGTTSGATGEAIEVDEGAG